LDRICANRRSGLADFCSLGVLMPHHKSW
jgi:hypothetical protein